MRRLAWAGFAICILASATPGADASHLGPGDAQAAHLNLVVHDVGATPGEPAPDVLPHFAVDGNATLEGVPVGEGGGPSVETFRAYDALYREAAARPAGMALEVAAASWQQDLVDVSVRAWDAAPGDGAVLVAAWAFLPQAPLREAERVLPAVVVPHAFAFERLERVNGTVDLRLEVPVDGGRANDVGILVVASPDVGRNEPGAALQSASWWPGQSGPTIQQGRAVVARLLTEGACADCLAAEDAAIELMRLYGPAAAHDDGGPSYWGGASGWVAAAAVAGAAGAVAAVARRGRAGGGS